MIEAGAAFVAWLGASLLVLAEGRRGLALALAVTTIGLAVIVLSGAGPFGAGAMVAGGGVASARRLTTGPQGWGLMPAGSTPRFILCVAVGLLAVWFALAVTTGAGAGLRFAAVSVVALSVARVLSNDAPEVLLTATGVLGLAVAAASGLADSSAAPWPYLGAAVIAAGAGWIRVGANRAA